MSGTLFVIIAVGLALLALGVGLTVLFVWLTWRNRNRPRQ
jgi:uncharacterized membrane protein YqjE